MNRTRVLRLLIFLLAAAALVQAQALQGRIFDYQVPGNTRALRLWLPSPERESRAILIWGNGAGSDNRDAVLREDLQAFAEVHDLALVGTAYFQNGIRTGEGQMILDALTAFAAMSAHPELQHAPIVFTGHSNGGQMAYEFNAWQPARTIAFSVSKGGFYISIYGLSPASLATPGVLSAGELDLGYRVAAINTLFDVNRPLGANWSLVVEEGMQHQFGPSQPLFLLSFERALEQRLAAGASALHGPVELQPIDQDRAWLADNSTWRSGITQIYPQRGFQGDVSHMSWLIDQDAAFVYRGVATYQNPLRLALAGGHGASYGGNEDVTLECTDFGTAEWRSVGVYDGALRVGEVTRENPRLVLRAPQKPGAHGGTLVGELPGGELRTSLPVAWVVRRRAPDALAQDSVRNAASGASGAVAPGELLAIHGTRMGPAELAGYRLDPSGRMNTELAGTRVWFDEWPAPLLYTSDTEVGVIAPYGIAGRSSTQLRIEYSGQAIYAGDLPVAATAPGLFTADMSGSGQGAILNQDFSANSRSRPAEAGSWVALFLTGEGQTVPAGVDGAIAGDAPPTPALPVRALIDGQYEAEVLYAGGASTLVAGVTQVNVRIPPQLGPGDWEIVVFAGQSPSQPGVTLRVRGQ